MHTKFATNIYAVAFAASMTAALILAASPAQAEVRLIDTHNVGLASDSTTARVGIAGEF